MPLPIPLGTLSLPYGTFHSRLWFVSRALIRSAHWVADTMAPQCLGSWSAGTPTLPAALWKETGGLPEIPGLPLWTHAPLSDPGGDPITCHSRRGLLSSEQFKSVDFRQLPGYP